MCHAERLMRRDDRNVAKETVIMKVVGKEDLDWDGSWMDKVPSDLKGNQLDLKLA